MLDIKPGIVGEVRYGSLHLQKCTNLHLRRTTDWRISPLNVMHRHDIRLLTGLTWVHILEWSVAFGVPCFGGSF
jgi:hypothetical protein